MSPAPATGIGMAPLSATTLADQIADRMIAGIAARQLRPGQRLTEAELAAELRVSRVPVREAMQALASQGILVPAPRRGLQVAPFDPPWAQQLCEVRLSLERLCARLVVQRLRHDPGCLAPLDAAIAALAAEAGRGERDAVNRADIAFHAALYAIADSPLLTALWSGIARHVLILFSIETFDRAEFSYIVAEHRRYRDALAAGRLAAIDREIEAHLTPFRQLADASAHRIAAITTRHRR
ncbi:MAG: GntR family transcriptional regulator [Dongiaceae bacterium]